MLFDISKVMIRMFRYMALLGLFLGAAGAANAAPPTISLNLNAPSYVTGDTMSVSVSTVPGNPPTTSDVYIALQIPGGTFLFMQPDGSFSANMAPFVSGIPLPVLSNLPIFGLQFSGAEPMGAYTWFAGVADPGTLNFQSGLGTAQFNFTPANQPNAIWDQSNWGAAVWQ